MNLDTILKMLNSSLGKIAEKIGGSGIIVTIVLILLYLIFKVNWVGNLISLLTNPIFDKWKNKKEKITESSITNHDIFNYIDFWINSKIPTINFSTEYRTAVFRRYLLIYLKVYKESISKFILDTNYQTMDESQIWKAFLNLINDIIYKYEREMEDNGIPKLIIEKMKVKNNNTISLTMDLIEGICSSQFYESKNNYLKMLSMLNILLSILDNTISNSVVVCNSINGQLKGLYFEGKMEPLN